MILFKCKKFWKGMNKMKKAFKTLAMTLVMALTVTTMAFADSAAATKLQEKLRALGVADTYIGATVEYLQKVQITDAQLQEVNAKIDAAKALIGNETNLSKLDSATKDSIKGLAQEAASTLGLKVSFGKNDKGTTTATITDANGKTILSLSSSDLSSVVKNFNVSDLVDVVKTAAEFSNSADKNKFTPVSGSLNKTATNTGNVMAAGLGLVALAGALFVGSKKVFA